MNSNQNDNTHQFEAKQKVVLVTTFSPDIGGGAVVLNSILNNLEKVNIEWVYLNHSDCQSSKGRYVAKPLLGGPILQEILDIPVWFNLKSKKLDDIVAKLCQFNPDYFWVVGHYEGLLIAKALAKAGKAVHLSVHDDTPYGMFGRSRRYQALSFFAQHRLSEVLKMVRSVDVISKGMQEYYKQLFKIESFVSHRYISALEKLPSFIPDSKQLVVGHIGAIYSAVEFDLFCQSLKEYGESTKIKIRLELIGISGELPKYLEKYADFIDNRQQLSENQAIRILSQCNFLYCMYPFAPKNTVFRKTSLPTKLSTYIQAQRPIFAHTPGDSSLAELVNRHKIGLVCASLQEDQIIEVIERMCHFTTITSVFEQVRAEIFGINNVKLVEKALLDLSVV